MEIEEIYDLKNRFIELLYNNGYCEQVASHSMELPAKFCFCDSEGCHRCDYSGIYLEAKTVNFFYFQFKVGGKKYNWHQLTQHVKMDVEVKESRQDIGEIEVKPLMLKREKLSEGKQLIKWVLEQTQKQNSKDGSIQQTEPRPGGEGLFQLLSETGSKTQEAAQVVETNTVETFPPQTEKNVSQGKPEENKAS